MKIKLAHAFLFFLTICFAKEICAQDSKQLAVPVDKLSKESSELISNLANAFLKETRVPGFSIAASKNGKLIYAQAFGYSDLENQVKLTPAHQLRTASVAKVITATALGKLISESKVDLDAPIKKYISYINPKYAELTTRQLAGHTSGMTHRPAGFAYQFKQYDSVKETVELIKAKLLFKPDTKYQYSTNAFNLVAAVIEGASGKTFTDYLAEEVFKPLEMRQTFPENIDSLGKLDAQLYYFKKGELTKEKLTRASYKLAGAGFRSTPTDLVNMMNGYSSGFISSKTVAEMFKSHQLADGKKTRVGVVWRSTIDAFGMTPIEHAGNWKGARAVVVHYPKEKLNVAIMINAQCPVFIEETAHLFAQAFRRNAVDSPGIKSLEQNVEVTFRADPKKEKILRGKLSLNDRGTQGMLTVQGNDESSFLNKNPVFYLGQKNQYVALTRHGLMYLRLKSDAGLKGDIFLYANRNEKNPTESKAIISFKEIK